MIKLDLYLGDDEEHYVAVVTSYRAGDPGRIWGPPEHCYPPEPAEIDWELCTPDGKPAPDVVLSEQRIDSITCELLQLVEEEKDDYEPDYTERWHCT
jgi:hypothetical protein